MIKDYSVLVVGGGPVGCAVAQSIASSGASVCIIEKSLTVSEDPRGVSVSLGSKQWLDSCGLWGNDLYAEPIRKIITEESGHSLVFDDKLVPYSPFGYIVRGDILRAYMRRQIDSSVDWVIGEDVTAIDEYGGYVYTGTSSGKKIRAQLLIAADGRSSSVRSKAKIYARTKKYAAKALVFSVEHTEAHQGVAHEIFLSSGPLAFLPMGPFLSSVVWSVDALKAEALMQLSEEEFLAKISSYAPSFYGHITTVKNMKMYPLGMTWVPRPSRGRIVLAGDAAHAIHPMAGQGMNLGIRDAKILSNFCKERYALGLDLGGVTSQYGRARCLDVSFMSGLMHSMHQVFSRPQGAVRSLGGRSMRIFGGSSFLKRLSCLYAMGKL